MSDFGNRITESAVLAGEKRVKTRPLSVLVIDDEPEVCRAAQLGLRSTGWTVTSVTDARKGLKLAKTIQPDLIICDAVMPDFCGTELIEALKSERTTRRIPIVLMSGYDVMAFADAQWTKFLPKPFGPVELRAVIESTASRPGDVS